MERYLSNPNVDKTIVNVIQVYEGGTGGTTVKEAQENLDILDKSTIGTPNGLAILPPTGLFGGSIEGGVDGKPMIDGPEYVRTNQTNRFFITNYDIKTGYEISTSMGSIERDNDYLIFKSGPEVGVAKIKVNNLEVELPIYLAIIGMPFIVSPQSGRDDINGKVEIKTSDFVTGEVDTYHYATDWQLSTTVEMDNIFKSVEKDTKQLTTWNVEGLQENVTYYIRFRYWDNVGNKSSWSEITQFKTRVSFAPNAPVIVDPSNGAKEQKADVTFVTTPFSTYEDVTHVSSDWQVSTSSVFAGLIEESEANEVNLESWTIGGLKTSTLYYVRVRHTDSKGRKSDWSLPSRFTTRKSFAADTPKIISPVEAEENHNSSLTIVASHFSNGDSRVTHQSSDWEISEDNSFQYPFLSSYSNSTSKVEWLANKLKPATTYYVRVRYRDTLSFVTDWSKPVSFKTKDSFAPGRPVITDPMNNTEDVGPWLDMRTSAYVSNNQGDEHLNSDWEIGTSLVFKDLVKWNTATIDDKIGWRVKGLEEASQYFVRVRHRAIKDGEEVVSDWSPVVKFNTKPSFAPGRPTITYPKSGSKDINENVTFTSTNYEPSDSQDVHVNSDWEIATNSAFTDVIQSNYGSATAKTAWVVTNLKSLTTFFVRVRHRTINDGIYYVSEWSSANNFTVEHEAPAKPVILLPSNGATRVSTTTAVTCSAYVAGEDEEKHFSSSWEISLNGEFNPVEVSSINSTTNKVSWNPPSLQPTTTYFVRVKHIGSLGFESEWSDASQFTTKTAATSNAPTITSPAYGATNVNTTVTITSSTFSSTEVTDNHVSSDWELATDSSFSNKVKTSTGSSTDRTSWPVSGLLANTTYYVRVRHNGSDSGPSPWSGVVNFTTKSPEVVGQVSKPIITAPTNGNSNLSVSFTITASAFSSIASGDSHKATDWEVSKDINFSNMAKSSYDNTTNKTSWSVGGLDLATSYYLRVRYKGTTGGNSPWSDTVSVATSGGSVGTDTPPEYTETFKEGLDTLYRAFQNEVAFTDNGQHLFCMDETNKSTRYGDSYGLVRYTVTGDEIINKESFPNDTQMSGARPGIEGSTFQIFSPAKDGSKILIAYTDVHFSQIQNVVHTYTVVEPLHVADFTTGQKIYLPTPLGLPDQGCATPDYKTIIATGLGKVYLVKNKASGTGLSLIQTSEASPPGGASMGGPVIISSDGQLVFATSTSSTSKVYVFSVTGDEITYRYTIQLQGHNFLHPDPRTKRLRTAFETDATGSTVIFSANPAGGADKACYIYERVGGNYEWNFTNKINPGGRGETSVHLSNNGKLITISSEESQQSDPRYNEVNVYFYYKLNGQWVNYKKHTQGNVLFDTNNSIPRQLIPKHLLAKDMSRLLICGGYWNYRQEYKPGHVFLNRSDNIVKPPLVKPTTPSIYSPSSGAVISTSVTFKASVFTSTSGTHASSDWEIATDSSFTNIVKSAYANQSSLTEWTADGFTSGGSYYARVRYISSEGGVSGWSASVGFSVSLVSIAGANGITTVVF